MRSIITSTIGERLKYLLVPSWLYIRYRVSKEHRRGEAEIGLLGFLVDRARNAVDVGANKGVYTHVISKLARHTYAYEPNPKMFGLLKRNIETGVTASPIALSDRTGRSDLRIPFGRKGHSNQGASLSETKVSGAFTPVSVETARLDDLGLSDIGFIKIDVEGFEGSVLDGARQTIARDRPSILIEIEEKHTKIPIEDSLQQVLAMGYQGLFVQGGALHPLSAFDPVAHHRQPTAGYVFNFIFLPDGAARAV
jgi:FkbM family methyltransferase